MMMISFLSIALQKAQIARQGKSEKEARWRLWRRDLENSIWTLYGDKGIRFLEAFAEPSLYLALEANL